MVLSLGDLSSEIHVPVPQFPHPSIHFKEKVASIINHKCTTCLMRIIPSVFPVSKTEHNFRFPTLLRRMWRSLQWCSCWGTPVELGRGQAVGSAAHEGPEDGVGHCTASAVCTAQGKGLRGALLGVMHGAVQRCYYHWQCLVFENSDWHLCWKGLEARHSLPFRAPWRRWLGAAVRIAGGVQFRCALLLWQLKCKSLLF